MNNIASTASRQRSFGGCAVLGLMLAAVSPTLAQSTGVTGLANPAPISRDQPSLALHFAIQHVGIYGLGVPIRIFAFSDSYWSVLTSQNWIEPDGRAMLRSDNQVLFLQLGTTYGAGNGTTTFNLPDLRGRSPMGEGQRPGASNYTRGQLVGDHEVTLTPENIPAHSHTVSSGLSTGLFGNGQPFSNIQPSAVIPIDIAVAGIFPSRGNGTEQGSVDPSLPFYGQVLFHSVPRTAGNDTMPANGSTLGAYQNTALFSILGDTYGGNTYSTFKIPDFRGTLATGGSWTREYLPDRSSRLLGERYGAETTALFPGQLPTHSHTVPGQPDTSFIGSSLAVDNAQPTLAVTWCIARGGVFPAGYMDDQYGYVGEIIAFAGNFAPIGFAECNGQYLNKNYDSVLFYLIGYTFGGSGDYFAVPDLRSRVPVMATASLPAGTVFGSETVTLTADNLPAHAHTLPVVCLADINTDGVVDGSDFVAFINSFAIGDVAIDPKADVAGGGTSAVPDPDGTIDGNDFVAFVNAFALGC